MKLSCIPSQLWGSTNSLSLSSPAGLRHCRWERGRSAQGSAFWLQQPQANGDIARKVQSCRAISMEDMTSRMMSKFVRYWEIQLLFPRLLPKHLHFKDIFKVDVSTRSYPWCHNCLHSKKQPIPMAEQQIIRFFGAQRAAEALKLQEPHREDGRMTCKRCRMTTPQHGALFRTARFAASHATGSPSWHNPWRGNNTVPVLEHCTKENTQAIVSAAYCESITIKFLRPVFFGWGQVRLTGLRNGYFVVLSAVSQATFNNCKTSKLAIWPKWSRQ